MFTIPYIIVFSCSSQTASPSLPHTPLLSNQNSQSIPPPPNLGNHKSVLLHCCSQAYYEAKTPTEILNLTEDTYRLHPCPVFDIKCCVYCLPPLYRDGPGTSINNLGPNPECLLVMMSYVTLGSFIDVSECPFSQLQDGVNNIYMLSEYLEDSVSKYLNRRAQCLTSGRGQHILVPFPRDCVRP